MSIDYKEKIRKLLALAESPIEAEAKAALLKARRLMVEHKLMEQDCRKTEKQAVRNVMTDITCSKRRDPWIVSLSAVIGENYCCKGYRNRQREKQTNYIGFIGLEDDVEICTEIFKYAVDCIRAGVKNIKKEYEDYMACYATFVKQECDSYGYGFVNGIQRALQQQKEENKQTWGLVLVTPEAVEAAARHLKKKQFKSRAEDSISAEAFRRGLVDGKKFDPTRRLTEQQQNETI